MKPAPIRQLLTALATGSALLALNGCTLMLATGDVDMKSAEKTTAKDRDERMTRLRDSGSLNPAEHEQLSQRMGYKSQSESAEPPSIEELEKQVEADRKAAGK